MDNKIRETWKPSDHTNSFVALADWDLGTPRVVAFIRKSAKGQWGWKVVGSVSSGDAPNFGEAQKACEKALREYRADLEKIERPEDHPDYPFGKCQSAQGLDV